MQKYQKQFDTLIWVKTEPNTHELGLFARAELYIAKLAWIPGIEMVAVVNSLSMYATHEDSDIDLFIITKADTLWLVRLLVTLTFWRHGVWRHGEDIAGNFCLSFFVTTDAMDMSHIALEQDIYLYNWIYYLKPIFTRGDIYERFLQANSWIHMDEKQKQENKRFEIQDISSVMVAKNSYYLLSISYYLNYLIRFFWLPKTLRSHARLGRPEWVIISDDMLKFHDQDRRKQIRDTILEKDFDK